MSGLPDSIRSSEGKMKVTERLWEEGPQKICIFIDGCARGNPGHAGCGVLVKDVADRILLKKGRYVGTTTNNVAEYMALIDGLREAVDLGTQEVTVLTDSELVVKQMNGDYRVKDVKLKELYAEAQRLSRSFAKSRFVHVARSSNREADSLANDAVDSYLKVDVQQGGEGPGGGGRNATPSPRIDGASTLGV